MRMPLGFPPQGLESGLGYAAADGDIFVASYPKSGTTWLQYVVYLLIRGRALAADEMLTDRFPHLEEVGAEGIEALPEPRLIKTHLTFASTPYSARARYVVIARNPFDCAVSFFHHTRGFPQHYDFADGSFADFFESFITGEVDFGDYFDHLLSWYAVAQSDNVLFMTYEALQSATTEMIQRLAAFLGAAATARIASAAGLEWVLEESSLPAMQREQQRWSSARPDWAPAFVRKGAVGDWQSLFTRNQARALLAEYDRRLAGTGLATAWPEVITAARVFAT